MRDLDAGEGRRRERRDSLVDRDKRLLDLIEDQEPELLAEMRAELGSDEEVLNWLHQPATNSRLTRAMLTSYPLWTVLREDFEVYKKAQSAHVH